MAVARRVRRRHPRRQAGRRSATALLYALGNLLVYGPLRNVLGMSRIRVAYTAGAAIGPDLFRFYRSIGINLKQLYGSTETCAYVCLQPDGEVKLDSRGQPAPGVEAEDRRRRRSAGARADAAQGVLQASRRDGRSRSTPKASSTPATPATSTPTATCKIIDRAKDVGKLAERRDVRAQLHREQAQVLPAHQGGGRASATGATRSARSINIDFEAVGNWAERRGIAYSRLHRPRAASPRCYALIARVHREGQRRPRDARPAWRDTQIAPLPGPAQGARPRRRRAHAHAQGAARLHRREVRACWSTRSTAARPSSTSRRRCGSRTAAPAWSAADLKIADAKTLPALRASRAA